VTDQQSNKVIIVLSPGRSGTSLLMQALGALGMSMSENMVPGNFSNPDGHFEDKDIMELHIRLFFEIGGHPSMPLPEGWLNLSSIQPIKRQLTGIFKEQILNSSSIWGFKDPRTNAFLPLWFRIMNSEKITPLFIFAARKPETTIASFIKQYNDSPYQAELAWLTRTTDAFHHTAADCLIVHYEDWFTRPKELALDLLRHTGLDHYFTGNIEEALQDVIKPNLNRAVYEDYEVQNEYVIKLCAVLKDCRGNDFDRARLMSVVKECRKAMDGFKGWYMDAYKSILQKNQVMEKLEKERVREKELKAELDEHRQITQKLQEKFKQAQADYELNLVQKEKDLEKELVRGQELVKLGQEMRCELQEITLQNNEYLKQIKDLHDQKEELRVRLSSRQAEKLRNEVDQLNTKLKMLRKSITFQAGVAIREAIKQPLSKGPLLPWRLIKLFREKGKKSQY
jgi:hypothetical protein